jgi:glycosyltransferase involved in cell wall biosynthesis
MKIGWATPLHPSSAISRFSVGVAHELSRRGVAIDLLRTERRELLNEPHLPSGLNMVNLAGMGSYRALRSYDLLVYNIGDAIHLHHHTVAAAMQIHGICIFHDAVIYNLFNGWAGDRAMVEQTINGIYGPGTFRRLNSPEEDPAQAAANYPMLEWLAPFAVAAVAHSRHYTKRLEGCCSGPVRHIPLAYDLPEKIKPPRTRSESDILRLATIGHVNQTGLCAEVIQALGASRDLRLNCSYRIAGPISRQKREELDKLAEACGVSLNITGTLSRSALVREIEDADAILCLRRPAREGASTSAIEAMLSGRPTIVLDHGFYQDLPDELVLKIPPHFAIDELDERVSWLLKHPEASREMGRRAALWASSHFSFGRYADAFLQLAAVAPEAEPLMQLGTQLGQELLALGVSPGDPLASRLAETATALFCPDGKLLPADMTGEKPPADFRMLTAIHATMRASYPVAAPLVTGRNAHRKKRGRAKRILREIARPFKRLVRSWRGFSLRKANAGVLRAAAGRRLRP